MLRGHTKSDVDRIRRFEAMDPDEFPMAPMLAKLAHAKGNDQLMILTAHGFVERFLTGILKHSAKRGRKVASLAHGTKLLFAGEMGLLADREYEELIGFSRFRNEAAHEAYFVLTEKQREHLASNRYFDEELLSITYPDRIPKPEDLIYNYAFFSIYTALCLPTETSTANPST